MSSRKRTFGAALLGVMLLATVLNIAFINPAGVTTLTTTQGRRTRQETAAVRRKQRDGPDSHAVPQHTAASKAAEVIYIKALGDQPTLSWVVSDALQDASKRLLSSRGDEFLALFDAFHASGASQVEHHLLDQTCGYMSSHRHHKLSKVDYSHRVKRKGEYTTLGLYHKVQQVARDGKDFFAFGETLPDILNQEPVQLSGEFDLSEPFGSWSTSFLPLNATIQADILHGKHKAKREGKQKRTGQWLRIFHPPQRLEPQPPPFVALFHNAVVSHGHVVSCDGNVLTAGGCLWDFHLPAIASSKDVHREPVAISLCDEWCKGYYHFTHEHLPRVAVVHRLLMERNDTKLVLSHSPTGFQRQFLSDILGIPPAQIVHGKAVLGHTVVYPTPMRCGNTFTSMLYLMRRIVYDRMDLGEGPTLSDGSSKIRLLFAERKHLSRMPKNYPALKQRLMHEFESDVEFDTTQGDTSARQQIEMFHKADIVVGPHGANIANMMWMRHGTHVIEMASRRKGNMCYYATASRINVTHHLVLHNKGKDASYELAYEYLQKHVALAVARLKQAAAS